MKRNLIIILILITSLLTGCIGVSSEFKAVRSKLIASLNTDLEREFEFSVGPSALYLAGLFVSFADDEHSISELIQQVSRVQVGVFRYKDKSDMKSLSFKTLEEISDQMVDEGWEYIVRSMDGDEFALVFVKSGKLVKLNELFVISLTDEELVFANVYGNLDNVIDIVIREQGLKLKVANN